MNPLTCQVHVRGCYHPEAALINARKKDPLKAPRPVKAVKPPSLPKRKSGSPKRVNRSHHGSEDQDQDQDQDEIQAEEFARVFDTLRRASCNNSNQDLDPVQDQDRKLDQVLTKTETHVASAVPFRYPTVVTRKTTTVTLMLNLKISAQALVEKTPHSRARSSAVTCKPNVKEWRRPCNPAT